MEATAAAAAAQRKDRCTAEWSIRNRPRTHTGGDVRQALEWKETTRKIMFCLAARDCAMDRTNPLVKPNETVLELTAAIVF